MEASAKKAVLCGRIREGRHVHLNCWGGQLRPSSETTIMGGGPSGPQLPQSHLWPWRCQSRLTQLRVGMSNCESLLSSMFKKKRKMIQLGPRSQLRHERVASWRHQVKPALQKRAYFFFSITPVKLLPPVKERCLRFGCQDIDWRSGRMWEEFPLFPSPPALVQQPLNWDDLGLVWGVVWRGVNSYTPNEAHEWLRLTLKCQDGFPKSESTVDVTTGLRGGLWFVLTEMIKTTKSPFYYVQASTQWNKSSLNPVIFAKWCTDQVRN